MRMRAFGLAAALLFAAEGALFAQQVPAESQALLEKARTAFQQRENAAQAKAAVDLFKQAAAADPKSYAALWEGAKACYFYGNYTREDAEDSEKLAIFQDGIDRAKAAVALDPKGVEGHFWLGVLDGVYGETKGIFKSLSMVPLIKQEMATCMELDTSVEGYGPDRVLGRLYYKLPGFKGGDNKKSIEYLEASLKGEPASSLTMLYLAEVCKSEGQKDRAIALVRQVVSMTPDPRWAPEHRTIKARAQKLLDKWT